MSKSAIILLSLLLLFLFLGAIFFCHSGGKLDRMKEISRTLEQNPLNHGAWDELNKMAHDADPLVRNVAVYSACNLYHNRQFDLKYESDVEALAWPFVLQAFEDPHVGVRQAAYQCAGFFPSKAQLAIPYLVHGLSLGGSPGAYAADSIANFGGAAGPAIKALVRQLENGPRLKGGEVGQLSSANALGRLGKSAAAAIPDLEEIIRSHVSDPEFRLEVVEALYKIDPNNAVATRMLDEFESGKYGEMLSDDVKNRIRRR